MCHGAGTQQRGCYPPMTPVNRFFRSALFPLIVIVLLVYLASQTLIPRKDAQDKVTYSEFIRQAEVGERAGRQVHADPPADQGDARRRPEGQGQLSERPIGVQRSSRSCKQGEHHLRLQGQGVVLVEQPADLAAPVRAPDRLLDLPDEPGPGRRLEGDELRQVARETDDARLAEDRLQGRRRRRRGRRGAARDQGVPREPEEVPGPRRADPQGRPALRASRHR